MLRLVRTFRTKAGRARIGPKSQSSLDPFKRPAFPQFDDLPKEQQEFLKAEALNQFDKDVDKSPEMELPSEYSLIAHLKDDARLNRLDRDEIRANILHFFTVTAQAREEQLKNPEDATLIKRHLEDDRAILFTALQLLPKDHADIFTPEEYVAFFNLAKLGTVMDQARDMKIVCDLFYPLNVFRIDPYNEMEYLQLLLDKDKPRRALQYQQERLHHKNQDVKDMRWYQEFGVALMLSLGRMKAATIEATRIITQFGWLESNLVLHFCKTAADREALDYWTQQLLKQMLDKEAILTRDPAVSLGNLTFTNIITKTGGVKRPFCETEEELEAVLNAKTVSVAHFTELVRLYIEKGMDVKKLIGKQGVKQLLTDDADIGLLLATEAALVAKESGNKTKPKTRDLPDAALGLFETLTVQCPSVLSKPLFYTHWLNVLTHFDRRIVGRVLKLMETHGVEKDSSHKVAMATYYLKHDYDKAVSLLQNNDTPAIWGAFLRHFGRAQNDEKFSEVLDKFLSTKRKPSSSTIAAVINYYHKKKNYASLWKGFNSVTLSKYSPADHLKTDAVFSPELYKLLWKVLTEYYRASGDEAIVGKPSQVHSVAGSTLRADSVWRGEWVEGKHRVRKWELVNEDCAPAPRNLFLKMLAEKHVNSCTPGEVVPVFIRSGDFVGALAILRFYKEVVGYELEAKEAGDISQILQKIKKKVFQSKDFKRPVMDDDPLYMGLEVDLNLYIGDDITQTVEEVLECLKEGKSTDCI